MVLVFLAVFMFCGAVSAANSTTDDEVWYSTVGQSPALYAYNTTSNTTRNVTSLQDNYGDIAWGPDGNLYGVTYDKRPSINRINITTGEGIKLKNLTGPYNSMASDDLGWLYIASQNNGTFYRYNIYSNVFQQWINIEDYGVHGTSAGDAAFVQDDLYALWFNDGTYSLIKVTGLDADHRATAGTSVSTVIGELPPEAYGLARGSNNDLFITADFGIYRVSLLDNTIVQVIDNNLITWGASSKIYLDETTVDPTENSTVNTTVNATAKTIGMQKTGIPVNYLILAILMVLGGLVTPKRK